MTDPPYDKRIPDLLSLRQVADTLKRTKPGVMKLVARRELIGRQLDGAWFFRPVVVQKFIERTQAATTAEEDQ